jgi:hypothetical protein
MRVLVFGAIGIGAMGCASASSNETPGAAPAACPREWVATADGLADLPDLSEQLGLPATMTTPPSEEDKARARDTVSQAPEWCTAHTAEVERAYITVPNQTTLFWLADFRSREGNLASAHAAFTKFLRGPMRNEEQRAHAEATLRYLEQRTLRVGIVCDARAALSEVSSYLGHAHTSPFPSLSEKHLTCPARGAFRIEKRPLPRDLVASAPGCPAITITIPEGQDPAVFRLR